MYRDKGLSGGVTPLSTSNSSPTAASSIATTTTTPEKEGKKTDDCEAPPKHMNRRKLRQMLAALSFEHVVPKPRRRKKVGEGSKQHKKKSRNKTKKSGSKKSHRKLPESIPENDGPIVYGCTVDSQSSDVFFDAAGSEKDIPKSAARDSIVLTNIVVHHCYGFETVLHQENDNKHSHGDNQSSHETQDVSASTKYEDETENDNSEEDYYYYYEGEEQSLSGVAPGGDGSIITSSDYSASNDDSYSESTSSSGYKPQPKQYPAPPPPPPAELPLRFLRAAKGDPVEGAKRYKETLQWRKEEKMDTILREPRHQFELIKQHYPHFCHLKGRNGEPCFYEQPPKTNLKALRSGGVNLQKLLHHYAMITEYQWQYLERDDLMSSIYIIDLDGIRFGDFVGEAVDFVKKASKASAQHYPERAGYVFVINVPAWFKVIWNVVKPIIDESTLEKIYILRGKEEIRQHMQERIPLENIPPEDGGESMPLGQSPEEITLREWINHNNKLAEERATACDVVVLLL